MSTTAIPHLNFSGEARQALEFYRSVFGGELVIATYADAGRDTDSPDADAVLFGQVTAPDGVALIAYDVPAAARSTALAGSAGDRPGTRLDGGDTITGERFFVALRGDDFEEISARWEALAVGATVIQSLGPSPWTPLFGLLTDRFGITWSVAVQAPSSPDRPPTNGN